MVKKIGLLLMLCAVSRADSYFVRETRGRGIEPETLRSLTATMRSAVQSRPGNRLAADIPHADFLLQLLVVRKDAGYSLTLYRATKASVVQTLRDGGMKTDLPYVTQGLVERALTRESARQLASNDNTVATSATPPADVERPKLYLALGIVNFDKAGEAGNGYHFAVGRVLTWGSVGLIKAIFDYSQKGEAFLLNAGLQARLFVPNHRFGYIALGLGGGWEGRGAGLTPRRQTGLSSSLAIGYQLSQLVPITSWDLEIEGAVQALVQKDDDPRAIAGIVRVGAYF